MSEAGRSAARRWRWGGAALLVMGAIGGIALLAYFGLGQVLASVERIGWRGLGVLVLWSFIPFALLGAAWWSLEPRRGAAPAMFVWARMARDSATELLPFSQIGGLAVGARAAVLSGLAPASAFASTAVDVTAEMIAQLGFTGVGLALLFLRPGQAGGAAAVASASFIGLALSAAAACGFMFAQRRGGGLARALARRFLPPAEAATAAFVAELDRLYQAPLRLAAAVGLHLIAWIASAFGAWLALAAAGVPVGVGEMIAIESLVAAVRSAAFFTPMAIGVQEAAYAVVGPLFGLNPELALALSLVRRGRDVVIGLPVLMIWQGREGRRLIARWRR